MKWPVILLTLLIIFLPITSSTAEEEGVYLLISKSRNKLIIVLNEEPQYVFPIATGISAEKTPKGTFHIIRKVKNPWYIPKNIPGGDPTNPIGSRWLGLDVPGTDGYKFGIHGTNNPESIGKHVSQGCIRMNNRDVEWLFRHIPLGTKVIITH
ncbi:L,D-transpeptidase [Ammoniphilus sp. CFH 90114]|uniref:L,D-transpeptidase n=1 Tax=Ammoniphilus sp. CFH 90114 TaxID=2493665 RepID=UPI001F0B9C46|nr:L,D-transpeptidase [Ammoniphilus sp. CFH 90114]